MSKTAPHVKHRTLDRVPAIHLFMADGSIFLIGNLHRYLFHMAMRNTQPKPHTTHHTDFAFYCYLIESNDYDNNNLG